MSGRPLFWWFTWIKHLKTLWKKFGNMHMKFGSLVHELWSWNMAINGGSTQKYKEIEPYLQKYLIIWCCVFSFFFSTVKLIKKMWLTPRNMNFGFLVHELWSENPWFWTIAIYYREKWRPYFRRSRSDLEVFFFRIF